MTDDERQQLARLLIVAAREAPRDPLHEEEASNQASYALLRAICSNLGRNEAYDVLTRFGFLACCVGIDAMKVSNHIPQSWAH